MQNVVQGNASYETLMKICTASIVWFE